MIRQPRSSPLFPYTTLFRSVRTASSCPSGCGTMKPSGSSADRLQMLSIRRAISRARSCLNVRSEEHTSELQSLTNLVCRLLLEKKNDMNFHHCQESPVYVAY